jgi:hypothetical protein
VIIHIKNNFAGFPKEPLEEMMRGMPGGSHLELETTVEGVELIAVAYNFSTKKTLFHIATKGAGPTVDGEPYYSKYIDQLRNVHVRPVPRPALLSRYFLKFMKVDTHDMRRQSELGLEMKWIPKGENPGKFRLATTIFGQTVIDVLAGCVRESHEKHYIRDYTTKDFVELLASEMVDNELDGSISRPRLQSRRSVVAPELDMRATASTHRLELIKKEAYGYKQLHCIYCRLKSSFCCTGEGCAGAVVCRSSERNCYDKHIAGESPPKRRGKKRQSQEGREEKRLKRAAKATGPVLRAAV